SSQLGEKNLPQPKQKNSPADARHFVVPEAMQGLHLLVLRAFCLIRNEEAERLPLAEGLVAASLDLPEVRRRKRPAPPAQS
ncbi:hypothetical protein, partial [Pseudomonas aeruginosa]|uniref:hypothetical protein n=1 Tax=Pseudomonas aeruginosa TaxID=287 RepID=UPI0039682BFC